jgi:SEC-C motif
LKKNDSIRIQDLNDKNIIESINYLINFKTKTLLKIIQHILDKRKDALPYLINILETDRYWNLPWIPICVIHILSVIGGNQALQSIVKTIKKHYIDTEDWLTEEMSSILAQFGPEAFDTLVEMIRDRHLDIWIREGALRSLAMIAKNNNPEIRTKSIPILKEIIVKEQKKENRTILLNEFIELKDKDSIIFVKSLFERKMVNESDVTFDECIKVLNGEFNYLEHTAIRDPLEIFGNSKYYQDNEGTNYEEEEDTFLDSHNDLNISEFYEETPAEETEDRLSHKSIGKKIGRNEMCPCGSRKKYKKCCMMKII